MKNKDVIVGGIYEVRVSGDLVPLRVDRSCEKSSYQFSRSGPGKYVVRTVFSCTNLRTGRLIQLRASRLRRLLRAPGGAAFVSYGPRDVDHASQQASGRAFRGEGFVRCDGE